MLVNSNKGVQWIFRICKNVFQILSMKYNLSATFLSEIYGQSKTANQEMQNHSSIFVNAKQGHILKKQAMSKFVNNHNRLVLIMQYVFIVTKYWHLSISL